MTSLIELKETVDFAWIFTFSLFRLQMFYVAGAIAGACVSAAASGSLGSTPGVSLLSSFLGGLVLIFGARLAGGCTRYISQTCLK